MAILLDDADLLQAAVAERQEQPQRPIAFRFSLDSLTDQAVVDYFR